MKQMKSYEAKLQLCDVLSTTKEEEFNESEVVKEIFSEIDIEI